MCADEMHLTSWPAAPNGGARVTSTYHITELFSLELSHITLILLLRSLNAEDSLWPFISTLSSNNPRITTLNLRFHNRDTYTGSMMGQFRIREDHPWPPTSLTNILFSLSFPHLVDFHLEVLKLEWPAFVDFLRAHSFIRSFGLCTDELDTESARAHITRLAEVMPRVTYIRGCTDFLETFFEASSEALPNVSKLFVYDWKGSGSGIQGHIRRIFPKLPHLIHCQVRVEGEVDQSALVQLGNLCPHLKKLVVIVPWDRQDESIPVVRQYSN